MVADANSQGELGTACAGQDLGKTQDGSRPPRRQRRCARYLSEQDRRAVERGGSPSWEVSPNSGEEIFADFDSTDGAELAQRGTGENDFHLRENIPPHW